MTGKKNKLSPRELEVLHCIVEGLTDEEIASRLSISKDTVNTHRRRLKEKLEATNVASMVAHAFRKGYVN